MDNQYMSLSNSEGIQNRRTARIRRIAIALTVVSLGTFAAVGTLAQQPTAEPCSQAATQALDGRQLPLEEKPLGGVIKRNALDSKPCWEPQGFGPEVHRMFC
jgi:hypothetical protein